MDSLYCSAEPEEELDEVLHRQLEYGVEDMPVIDDDGTLAGAVNLTTVLNELYGAKSEDKG